MPNRNHKVRLDRVATIGQVEDHRHILCKPVDIRRQLGSLSYNRQVTRRYFSNNIKMDVVYCRCSTSHSVSHLLSKGYVIVSHHVLSSVQIMHSAQACLLCPIVFARSKDEMQPGAIFAILSRSPVCVRGICADTQPNTTSKLAVSGGVEGLLVKVIGGVSCCLYLGHGNFGGATKVTWEKVVNMVGSERRPEGR